MPKVTSGPIRKSILRRKAERLHSERPGKKQPRDSASLVHELEVHQIELEMQNKELQTARLVAEDSRNRYLDLYDFAPVGHLTLDEKGVISELNLTAAQLLGIERASLVGKPLHDFIESEFQDIFYLHIQRVLESSETRACELILKKIDGTSLHVQLDSIGIRINGQKIMHTILIDITERRQTEEALKESEERFRSLFETSKDSILMVNQETGRIIAANAAACSLYGYSLDEFLTLKSTDVSAEPERTEAAILRSISDVPFRLHRKKDGTVFPVEISGGYFTEGGLSLHTAFIRDITERRKAEEILDRAYRQLLEAKNEVDRIVEERTSELMTTHERLQAEAEGRKATEKRLYQAQKMEAIGTLASGIAEDFNNILGAVIAFAEMMEEDAPPNSPEQRRAAQVQKAGFRGRDLIKQILTLSRQTSREKGPVALRDVIEEVFKLLRPTLPSTVAITTRMLTNETVTLADSAQMHQILMNLCTNAAHAMKEKGGLLEISLEDAHFSASCPAPDPCMKLADYLKLSVRDTGYGMEDETLKRIFNPFFTTKAPGEGTGLGLSVVQGIVRDHEGCVVVDSEPGRGSTFHVYLPKLEASIVTEIKGVLAAPRGSERILFVDDEKTTVDLNRERLKSLGYKVVGSMSSKKALDILKNRPDRFDLVITDYTMPDLTGIDLAEELFKIRYIPVILCTDEKQQTSLSERAKKTGIKELLTKPLTKKDLAQAIRRVLDTKRGE